MQTSGRPDRYRWLDLTIGGALLLLALVGLVRNAASDADSFLIYLAGLLASPLFWLALLVVFGGRLLRVDQTKLLQRLHLSVGEQVEFIDWLYGFGLGSMSVLVLTNQRVLLVDGSGSVLRAVEREAVADAYLDQTEVGCRKGFYTLHLTARPGSTPSGLTVKKVTGGQKLLDAILPRDAASRVAMLPPDV